MNSECGYIRRLLLPALLAVVLVAAGWVCHARAADELTVGLTHLSGADYFPAVRREIQNAKQSIVVTMYVILIYPNSKRDSPPVALVEELIAARKRGVKVRVILSGTLRPANANQTAIERLLAGGVDLQYLAGSKMLHQKMVVIDDELVLVGSHNWTVSALTTNKEVSLRIRSESYVKMVLEEIDGFELRSIEPFVVMSATAVLVPRRFLTDRKLAPAMLGASDHRAFNLFLLLWRQFMDEGGLSRRGMTVSLDTVAESLGIKDTMARNAYRRQIIKTLEKLRDRYGLIECQVAHGGDATVRMARGGLKRPTARTARKTPPLPVPAEYWDYGWSRRLSHSAKFVYLICLAEQQFAPSGQSWSHSQEWIARKYTNAKRGFTMGNSLLELEQQDILQVSRDWPRGKEGFSDRSPNVYRLKPLLSEKQIEKAWEELLEGQPKKRVEKARELADMLDRPNSRETIGEFLKGIVEFGAEATEKETRKVAEMPRGHPFRHVGTVIYRLKKKAAQK